MGIVVDVAAILVIWWTLAICVAGAIALKASGPLRSLAGAQKQKASDGAALMDMLSRMGGPPPGTH